jgi:hypothetical protein
VKGNELSGNTKAVCTAEFTDTLPTLQRALNALCLDGARGING